MVGLAAAPARIAGVTARNADFGRAALGFDFRRVRSRRGVWWAHYTPKLKKRTALLRSLPWGHFGRYRPELGVRPTGTEGPNAAKRPPFHFA